jgi:hypothetical protein
MMPLVCANLSHPRVNEFTRMFSGARPVPYHVYVVEPPTLLDDLLEDSARVFHHHCVIIQRVFHDRWLELVGEMVAKGQIEDPDANPSVVESRARDRLRASRLALREKQGMLIQQERDRRSQRDAAIHAYVASLQSARERPAAA